MNKEVICKRIMQAVRAEKSNDTVPLKGHKNKWIKMIPFTAEGPTVPV